MNRKLNIALKIIYPFFVALLLWLFFGEGEQEIIWGIMVIGVFAGLGILLYFQDSHSELAYKLTLVCFGISYFALFSNLIFIPIILDLILAYKYIRWILFLTIILLLITIIIFTIFYRSLKNNQSFIRIAILRAILWNTVLITSLAMLYLFIRILIISVVVDDEIGAGALICIVAILVAFYQIHSRLSLFVYEENDFILYLRSFTYNDEKIQTQLTDCSTPILKIGNPHTLINKGLGKSIFLLSPWKPMVNYYINKSHLVISVLDITDGVMWEIFNHLDHYEKFVYYIPNNKCLDQILEQSGKNSNIVIKTLHFIKEENVSPCAFSIKGDICLYSKSLKDVLNGLLKDDIKSLSIHQISGVIVHPEAISKVGLEQDRLNNTASTLLDGARIFKRTITKCTSYVGKILGALFMIILDFVGPILISFAGLMTAFCPERTDMGLDERGIAFRIFSLAIGIISLIYLFKNINELRK